MSTETPKQTGTKKFGPYTLTRQLGKGGMGYVYEAYEESLDRTVAIKILNQELSKDSQFKARFLKEARTAAKLEHPHIATVFSVGEIGNYCYISMQHIKGVSLADHITKNGPLNHTKALNILKQAMRAIAFAHKQGIIHRDLKPGNIMIAADGTIKVLDFGLAKELKSGSKITETGTYLGTPEYSSPEQCEGRPLDGKTDIYSMGVVLYEMLSGKMPYAGDTPYALFSKIINEAVPDIRKSNPNVPEPVAQLLDAMLSKNSAVRPSADGIIAAIDDIIENRPLRKRFAAHLEQPKKSHASFAALAAGVILIVSAGILVFWSKTNTKTLYPSPITPKPSFTAATEAPKALSVPAPPSPAAFPKTMLVLDSQNVTGDPATNWIITALPEMLITDLSDCRYINLISRDVLRKKLPAGNAPLDLDSIPDTVLKDLNATLILTSSFIKAGDRLAVDAKVYEYPSGTIITAEKTENEESKIFAVIDDLSSKITERLDKKYGTETLIASAGLEDKPVALKLFCSPENTNAPENDIANADKHAESNDNLDKTKNQEISDKFNAVKMYYEMLNEAENTSGDIAFAGKAAKEYRAEEKESGFERLKDDSELEDLEKLQFSAPSSNQPSGTPAELTEGQPAAEQPGSPGSPLAEKQGAAPDTVTAARERDLKANAIQHNELSGADKPADEKSKGSADTKADADTEKEQLIKRLEKILEIAPDFLPAKKKLEELKGK